MGKIHPNLVKDDIYVFEISMNKLIDKKIKPIKFKEISKYPSVEKDLAFIVDDSVTSLEIIDTIKKSAGHILSNIDVFDLYKGENVPSNKKSIAYNLTFTDYNKTLNDDEVMKIFNKIISDVERKHSAILRDK